MISGALAIAGLAGDLWSKTAYTAYTASPYAYSFYFNDAKITLSSSDSRWYGFTVRKAKVTTIVTRRKDISVSKIETKRIERYFIGSK